MPVLGPKKTPSKTCRTFPTVDDVDHDLVSVFQVGWATLHKDVGMYAAEPLIRGLTRLRPRDREIQMELDAFRIRLAKQRKIKEPTGV
jgi:hypothetical protein